MKKISIAFSVFMFFLFAAPAAFAQIEISFSIGIAPPPLPEYAQPYCPGDGYMWTPGYWAYGVDEYNNEGYYWVPGVWVYPPQAGLYWTPPYWAYDGGYYRWQSGYWGPYVGFYGGVNYGYGYYGDGFGGGRWYGNTFQYNRAVMNVNTTIVHNTYVDRSSRYRVNNHSSYNGPGGVTARPNNRQLAEMHEVHTAPTPDQSSHHWNASKDNSQFSSQNHGRPSTAAMNSVGGNHYNSKGKDLQRTAPNRNQQAAPANQNQPRQDARPAEPQHANAPQKRESAPQQPRQDQSQKQKTQPEPAKHGREKNK